MDQNLEHIAEETTPEVEESQNNGFHWENLSIRFKVQLALFIVANIAIVTIGVLGYFSATNALEKVTFDQLTSVRETKRQVITNYFDRIKKQVTTFSESRMVVDAMKSFKNASLFLDNDFYGEVYPDSMLTSLNSYYDTEFLPRWQKVSLDSSATVEEFMIGNTAALKLQFYYISGNPYPTGSKDLLEKADDGSLYSDVHNKYHSIFRNYLNEFDFYDIFLIDAESGRIIYSVSKEIDYMSSLVDGPYRESNLARAYNKVKETPFRNYTTLTDFEKYAPSYDKPAAFIASPIFDKYKKIGVLVFQISPVGLNNILTGNQQWEVEGLGTTGETYIVGSDFKMRSDARMFTENPDGYFEMLDNNYPQEEAELIKRHQTTSLFQSIKTEAAENAINGITGTKIITNYRGTLSLSAYSDLDIEGVQWGIISEIEKDEAFELVAELRYKIIVAMIVIFAFTTLLGFVYSRWFVQPIKKLRNTLIELAAGKKVEKITVVGNDEIGQTSVAMNQLIERIEDASEFALAIGEGKFDHDFSSMSEEDRLGNSLSEMRDQLSTVAQEDSKRNWATEGIAQFADVLRNNSTNLDELADQSLYFIVDYVGLVQGGLYLIQQDNEQNEWLEMKACYAYDRKKFLNMKIEWGQGVVSQCWQDKDLIYMDNIPDDYPVIKTGTGQMKVKAIFLVPIILNEKIFGIIEVGSIDDIPEYKREFIQRITSTLASTMSSVISNLKTERLLKESQNLAKELTTREEEMRQNMEELKATQEQMKQRELENSTER